MNHVGKDALARSIVLFVLNACLTANAASMFLVRIIATGRRLLVLVLYMEELVEDTEKLINTVA